MRLVAWVLGCVLLLAMLLAWIFLATRAVVAVGGSCATSSAFVVANPCPDGTWLLAPAIPGVVIVALSGSGAAQDVGAPNLFVPMWALLFAGFTWNFAEAALDDFSVVWLLGALMFAGFAAPAVWEGRVLLRGAAWRSPEPGRPSLWWWTGCYLPLLVAGATVGIWTYTLIA